MQDLRDKVAFVTGGASGIGLGIVRRFLDAGMEVVIADLRQDHLDAAMKELEERQLGRRIHAIPVDVTDRAAMAAAADEAERVFGKVHVLVNNAGVGITGPLKEATYDDWDFAMGANLGGVINGLQTFLPRIRAHGEGGHVVSTASLAAMVMMPASMAMYAAAKAAVVNLMESIRGELAEDNIGVSVLCPGPVKSNIHELSKNRPERFGASQAVSSGGRSAWRAQGLRSLDGTGHGWDMVVRAIRNNELYIITHGEWREAAKARFDAMLAAMPTEMTPGLIEPLRPPAKTAE